MPDAKHTPPGDRSFAVSLARHATAGIALVLAVAAGFWAIGQVRPAEEGTVAAPTVTGEPTSPEPTGTEPSQPAGSPTDDPGSPPASPATGTPTEVPDQPSPTETAVGIDPAEISVQVLDAVLDDGGAAARAVADRLRGEGYRVVAVNRAVRVYQTTAVFYTSGSEAQARQVQAFLDFGGVQPQPGNLSEAVDVHVVVGRDAT